MFDLEHGCVHYRAVEGSIKTDAFYDMIINDVVRGTSPPRLPPPPPPPPPAFPEPQYSPELATPMLCVQVPLMNPFPERRSVLVLDNCVTHRRQEVVAAVTGIGAIIEFLPPYCPDVAIHERCLRCAKDYLRHQAPMLQSVSNLDAIDLAMRSVTPTHAREAMLSCGYPFVY